MGVQEKFVSEHSKFFEVIKFWTFIKSLYEDTAVGSIGQN